MSTILRSLNGTRKKKRTLQPDASDLTSGSRKNIQGNASNSVSAMLRNKGPSAFSGMGIKPLKEAESGDEISNI